MLSRLRRCSLALLAALVSSACLDTGSSVNAYGGLRSLDSEDFDGVDDQASYGIDGVLKLELPWLAIEGGWLRSEDEGSISGSTTLADAEVVLNEYFLGVRLVPWRLLIEPYGAVGVSLFDGSLDAQAVSESDSTFGYYARVGAAVELWLLRIGLDGRASFSDDVDFDQVESDVNSYQIALFLGIGF